MNNLFYLKKSKTILIIFTLFSLNIYSQNTILGEYCSKNKYDSSGIGVRKNCYIFKSDMTFEQHVLFDVGLILTGKYQIIEEKLILTVDNENSEEEIFDILENEKGKLIIKYKCLDCRSKKIKLIKK